MQRTLRQQASPAVQPSLSMGLQTTCYRVEELLHLVQERRLRMAPLEHGWRWSPEDVAALFESLLRGYPVGTLVLWKRSLEDAMWVVDGQHRLAALTGALLASPEDELEPTFDLYFDLESETFRRPANLAPIPKAWLPVRVMADTRALAHWRDAYRSQGAPQEALDRAVELSTLLLHERPIAAYVVETDDVDAVQRMLLRVSTAGKPRDAEALATLRGAPERAPPRELRVLSFLREDARIPCLPLVPYETALGVLAGFFDRHPEPSARSRQLLSRWVWRGAILGVRGDDFVPPASTISALQELPETAAVDALLRTLPPRRPGPEHGLGQFDLQSPGSRLEALALWALRPLDLRTGQPVRMSALLDATAGTPRLPALFDAPDASDEGEPRARTIANRIAHPPLPAPALRQLLSTAATEEILRSHAISRAAWEALREGDAAAFLAARSERLAEHLASFLEARAEWDQSDRPALTSLVITDDG